MALNIPDIIQLLSFKAFVKGFRHGQQEEFSFRALDLACLQNHSEDILGVFSKKNCPCLPTDNLLFQGHRISVGNEKLSADDKSYHRRVNQSLYNFWFTTHNGFQRVIGFELFEHKFYGPSATIKLRNSLCRKLLKWKVGNVKMIFRLPR